MDKMQYIKDIELCKGVTIIRLYGAVNFGNLKEVQDEYRSKMKGKVVKNVLFDVKDISRKHIRQEIG
jgi:hypothetical protein